MAARPKRAIGKELDLIGQGIGELGLAGPPRLGPRMRPGTDRRRGRRRPAARHGQRVPRNTRMMSAASMVDLGSFGENRGEIFMALTAEDFYRSSNGDRWQRIRDTASG